MNFAKFSVTRPVAVTMRIAALMLLGFICLLRIPTDLLPRVDIPTVAVRVAWPNTSPEEIETQITRPIEQAVSTVPGLYSVSSTSSLGEAFIRVQLDYGVNIDAAATDVLQYVQRAARNFPDDPNLGAPAVFKFDPSTLPVVVFGVNSSTRSEVELATLIRNEIAPLIESAGGVAQVALSGGQERAILVEVDTQKLAAYGLTINQIQDRIAQENLSRPAGIAKQSETEYTIRSVGYFASVKEIESLPVGAFQGRPILLREVAQVKDSAPDQRIFVRFNGDPGLSISVSKQTNANTIQTVEAVQERVKEIEKRYPDLSFGVAYDQSGFIEKSIEELKETALIGAVLAVLAILFFLRSVRSTIVIALSIPISIISTFSLLYFMGYTINTISLSGLALATGLIVDDAIVVLENIFRHIERDKKRAVDAAVTGSQEILSAVVASTITIIVVFFPLLLIKGQTGQTFTQFALVVIFSIAVSLLDATTVVPMLASRFIKEEEVEEESHPELRALRGKKTTPVLAMFDQFGRWLNNMDASYRRGLEWTLKHRGLVVVGAIASVAVVYPLIGYIGNETLPKGDSGDFTVNVKFPIGTALSTTEQKMARVEEILRADPDVENVLLCAGANLSIRGTSGNVQSNQGSALVRLKAKRKVRTEDVIKRVQKQLGSIGGARINAQPYDIVANIIGGANNGIGIDIFGQSLPQITAKAREVQEALKGIPGLESVDVNFEEASPEVQWKIDREKATLLGVSYADVASAIAGATGGILTTYYQENGFQYPIYAQLPLNQRESIESLKSLPVRTVVAAGTGQISRQILLGDVAVPTIQNGPNQITRLIRQRFVSVNGRVVDRPESAVLEDVTKALEKVEFENGVYYQFGEQQRRKAQEFSGLGLTVFLALALIYMLLASQFESFVYPLIVLVSVPFCAGGAIIALFVSGKAFGLTAYVGLLMLIGIVVKNGILLVDYTNQLRSRGLNRDEAVLEASPTRLRPILMTSICALLGMLPLAVGWGASSELQAPLAVVVVGGLISSTALTLFVVPIVYTYFDDLARKLRGNSLDLAAPAGVQPSPGAFGGSPEELPKSPINGIDSLPETSAEVSRPS